MWTSYQPWQLKMLGRLTMSDPERLETVLNTIWRSFPGLLETLAIGALDHGDISVEDCAQSINQSTEEVEALLAQYRNCDSKPVSPLSSAVIHSDEGSARLTRVSVPVWEIVREFRKVGAVDGLRVSFPDLSDTELVAALKYAEKHPSEIESQIQKYETLLEVRRNAYPFAR